MAYHFDYESYGRRFEEYKGIFIVYNAVDSGPELSLISTDHGLFELLGTVYKEGQQSILSSSSIIALVEQLLSKAKLKANAVDDVVISGDPSHLAEVRRVPETYFGKKPLAPTGFPTDHAVVYGSAIKGYNIVFDEQIDRCAGLYMGYTLLDLGIETSTGAFAKAIPRGYIYPEIRSTFVSTTKDGQENAIIRILEGAGQSALGTRELGTLQLTGLPPRV
ncbi:Hsp70 protein-domain-containing protein [Leptodontidium sp. 2 PMI_412]|nr:Hsp70 protein-domain-containing protein [Leptodontidium sp. 2 PMI_412]